MALALRRANGSKSSSHLAAAQQRPADERAGVAAPLSWAICGGRAAHVRDSRFAPTLVTGVGDVDCRS